MKDNNLNSQLFWCLQALLLILLVSRSNAVLALTEAEMVDLAYMREEEKLAHDLYLDFHNRWGNSIFSSIAESEQRHTDSVLHLLNLFGLQDPAAGLAPGVFSNSELQDLHDQLQAAGYQSELAALEVAIMVEETDIDDLDLALSHTSDPAITRVYGNLRRGSLNHLAAFSNQLEAQGGSGGDANGLHPGISIFEPISKSLYIPAINVMNGNGTIVVYDALLRLVESLPQTLVLLEANVTEKLPSDIHASFDTSTGLVTIPQLVVGALNFSSLEENIYELGLKFLPEFTQDDALVFGVIYLNLIAETP